MHAALAARRLIIHDPEQIPTSVNTAQKGSRGRVRSYCAMAAGSDPPRQLTTFAGFEAFLASRQSLRAYLAAGRLCSALAKAARRLGAAARRSVRQD